MSYLIGIPCKKVIINKQLKKAGKSLDDDEAVSALIVDLWDGSGRSPDNAILERRPNQEV